MRRFFFSKQMQSYFILPMIKAVKHLFGGNIQIIYDFTFPTNTNLLFWHILINIAKHFDILNVIPHHTNLFQFKNI